MGIVFRRRPASLEQALRQIDGLSDFTREKIQLVAEQSYKASSFEIDVNLGTFARRELLPYPNSVEWVSDHGPDDVRE